MMQIPSLIARPMFQIVYRIIRRASPLPPIKRVVRSPQAEEKTAFDRLIDSTLEMGPNAPIDYHLKYPKANFLNYICDWRGFVAHGSPLQDFSILQPIRLTQDLSEFGNRRQIFCSPDGTWAMWFAILDKSKIHMTENGCVRLGHGLGRIKLYHFGLPRENKIDPPFTNGMVYIARASDFPEHRIYPLLDRFDAEIEEWGSSSPVIPVAKLTVSPSDFPYLNKVQFYL